jgi:hypothetical protein
MQRHKSGCRTGRHSSAVCCSCSTAHTLPMLVPFCWQDTFLPALQLLQPLTSGTGAPCPAAEPGDTGQAAASLANPCSPADVSRAATKAHPAPCSTSFSSLSWWHLQPHGHLRDMVSEGAAPNRRTFTCSFVCGLWAASVLGTEGATALAPDPPGLREPASEVGHGCGHGHVGGWWSCLLATDYLQ